MKELPAELRIELEQLLTDLVNCEISFMEFTLLQMRARDLQKRIQVAYEAQS